MKSTAKGKKRLTYALKRRILMLESIIAIVIKVPDRKGGMIECDTIDEARQILEILDQRDAEKSSREKIEISRTPGLLSTMERESPLSRIGAHIEDQVEVSAWSKDSFWKFIESLGEPQVKLLSLLVRQKKASDEDIRKLLNVDGNQALAGVISGISKQAARQNVSARAVYTIEDERKAGERSKTYVIAKDFAFVASQMNWPGD